MSGYPEPLSLVARNMLPITAYTKKEEVKFAFKSGVLSFQVHFPSFGFCRGQRVKFKLSFENNSKETMRGFKMGHKNNFSNTPFDLKNVFMQAWQRGYMDTRTTPNFTSKSWN